MRRSVVVVIFAVVVAGFVAACGDNHKGLSTGGPDGGLPDGPGGTKATCTVTAGNATKLLKGTVLTSTTVYKGGEVAVDATGHITCVGYSCATGGETTISCPTGVISPGLINPHDHITFTQNKPYTDTGERYDDRQQWRIGLDGHAKIPSTGSATADQIRWGELRFLMGGATSIVGSGGQAGLLRNLDQAANQEGLGKKAVDFDTFPLGDSSGTRRTIDCNYGTAATTAASLATVDAYEPHTSEGIDATAHNEFLCESSSIYDTVAPVSNNLMLSKTAMIHAIGLQPLDYGAMAAAGTSLIWSPRSNLTLYGDTARVTTAAQLGVRIALGTDWMPTGSMNLLRELACADTFNATYLNHYFTDQDLWKMVTVNAAALTATDDLIGVLAPGKIADISIFASHGEPGFRTVIDAKPEDVALVMRGGKVLYGDEAVVSALAQSCDTVDVCGTSKQICTMAEVGKTYSALQAAVGVNVYPAFTCGPPPNEPSCVPRRPVSVASSTIYTGAVSATDSDGDGIPDATDNCPHTFNPVRPLDLGVQGDADGDGLGDACDPCPLDANTTQCLPVDLNDRDRDGAVDTGDDCLFLANPDQVDDDHDGKGNVCDACPLDANPSGAGCPKTIYQIKGGMVSLGFTVRLTNALVIGRGSNGFFVQVKETDPEYAGPDNSGLFVFTSTAPPVNIVPGARVTLDGSVANFQGELELDTVTIAQVAPGAPEALPAPIAVSYAEVKTGGARAAALEGVIVSLGTATVTATNATAGEITLTDSTSSVLIVDDLLFPLTPLPSVGQNYIAVSGILALRQMASKLEPRNAADLTLGGPGVASFGPAQSFVRVGDTSNAPTFPQPLTLTLTGPAQGATTIALVSSDPTALTVTDITIPDGATSATVPVTAVAQAADVVITATFGVQVLTAHVRVLGATEAPATVTLSPASGVVHPTETVTLTATLDVPAIVDTVITLALTPSDAGTVPATVTVLANQTSATFSYVNQATSGTIVITATFGASTSQATLTATTGPNHLVISQVYGGGGNSGATLKNDFIEIHNPGVVAMSLAGLSVQYTSATGPTNTPPTWATTALPNISVPPGGFVLVAEAAGTGGTVDLPTPDVIGTISMGATAGKVALVANTTALTTACPTASVIDLVGYGSTANCFEGTGPAPAPSNTTAVLRGPAGKGCDDHDDNKLDFASGTPTPRNSATTATCP